MHEITQPADTARRFHEVYEQLAPSFGYDTRKASAVEWDLVPENNRQLMRATCAIVEAEIRAAERQRITNWLRECARKAHPDATPEAAITWLATELDSRPIEET